MTNAETVELCAKLGVPVKSHSSSLNEAYADMVRRRAERDGLTRAEQPEELKPAKKAPAKKAAAKKSAATAAAVATVDAVDSMEPAVTDSDPTTIDAPPATASEPEPVAPAEVVPFAAEPAADTGPADTPVEPPAEPAVTATAEPEPVVAVEAPTPVEPEPVVAAAEVEVEVVETVAAERDLDPALAGSTPAAAAGASERRISSGRPTPGAPRPPVEVPPSREAARPAARAERPSDVRAPAARADRPVSPTGRAVPPPPPGTSAVTQWTPDPAPARPGARSGLTPRRWPHEQSRRSSGFDEWSWRAHRGLRRSPQ